MKLPKELIQVLCQLYVQNWIAVEPSIDQSSCDYNSTVDGPPKPLNMRPQSKEKTGSAIRHDFDRLSTTVTSEQTRAKSREKKMHHPDSPEKQTKRFETLKSKYQ